MDSGKVTDNNSQVLETGVNVSQAVETEDNIDQLTETRDRSDQVTETATIENDSKEANEDMESTPEELENLNQLEVGENFEENQEELPEESTISIDDILSPDELADIENLRLEAIRRKENLKKRFEGVTAQQIDRMLEDAVSEAAKERIEEYLLLQTYYPDCEEQGKLCKVTIGDRHSICAKHGKRRDGRICEVKDRCGDCRHSSIRVLTRRQASSSGHNRRAQSRKNKEVKEKACEALSHAVATQVQSTFKSTTQKKRQPQTKVRSRIGQKKWHESTSGDETEIEVAIERSAVFSEIEMTSETGSSIKSPRKKKITTPRKIKSEDQSGSSRKVTGKSKPKRKQIEPKLDIQEKEKDEEEASTSQTARRKTRRSLYVSTDYTQWALPDEAMDSFIETTKEEEKKKGSKRKRMESSSVESTVDIESLKFTPLVKSTENKEDPSGTRVTVIKGKGKEEDISFRTSKEGEGEITKPNLSHKAEGRRGATKQKQPKKRTKKDQEPLLKQLEKAMQILGDKDEEDLNRQNPQQEEEEIEKSDYIESEDVSQSQIMQKQVKIISIGEFKLHQIIGNLGTEVGSDGDKIPSPTEKESDKSIASLVMDLSTEKEECPGIAVDAPLTTQTEKTAIDLPNQKSRVIVRNVEIEDDANLLYDTEAAIEDDHQSSDQSVVVLEGNVDLPIDESTAIKREIGSIYISTSAAKTGDHTIRHEDEITVEVGKEQTIPVVVSEQQLQIGGEIRQRVIDPKIQTFTQDIVWLVNYLVQKDVTLFVIEDEAIDQNLTMGVSIFRKQTTTTTAEKRSETTSNLIVPEILSKTKRVIVNKPHIRYPLKISDELRNRDIFTTGNILWGEIKYFEPIVSRQMTDSIAMFAEFNYEPEQTDESIAQNEVSQMNKILNSLRESHRRWLHMQPIDIKISQKRLDAEIVEILEKCCKQLDITEASGKPRCYSRINQEPPSSLKVNAEKYQRVQVILPAQPLKWPDHCQSWLPERLTPGSVIPMCDIDVRQLEYTARVLVSIFTMTKYITRTMEEMDDTDADTTAVSQLLKEVSTDGLNLTVRLVYDLILLRRDAILANCHIPQELVHKIRNTSPQNEQYLLSPSALDDITNQLCEIKQEKPQA